MTFKKTVAAIFGFLTAISLMFGIIFGIVKYLNSESEKKFKNEMGIILNEKSIQSLEKNLDKVSKQVEEITPHIKTLIELFKKTSFIVIKDECDPEDYECLNSEREQYVTIKEK